MSRLTSATEWTDPEIPGWGGAATQLAVYDPYGNITSLTTNAAGPTLTTSTATNRLSSATYNSKGSMTSWNLNTYVYEPLGMTSTITASGVTTYHVYTADDERAWTFQPGAPSRWTIRDLDGKVLRELSNNAGTWFVEKDYVYRDGSLLAAATAAEILHYHPDHLGSPRLITGAGGVKKSYHLYHPYGAEATAFNQDTERLKFTGHERDLGNLASAADDIDYMHARFYQPQVGRFLGVDPVLGTAAQPQSWNRYSYVGGNPLRNVDPDGQMTGSALADSIEGPIRELKDELTNGLNDGTVFGIIASTLVGTALDGAVLLTDPLRLGSATGEAVGSGASAGEVALAVVADTARGVAIAAPLAGAGRAALAARGPAAAQSVFTSATATGANKTIRMLRSGGLRQAYRDFARVTQGVPVKNRGHGLRTATLRDGTRVTVRPSSSGGQPTLDLIRPDSRPIKIRYE
jgi:RHS repeat-associated protein